MKPLIKEEHIPLNPIFSTTSEFLRFYKKIPHILCFLFLDTQIELLVYSLRFQHAKTIFRNFKANE
jgi:hypothetical protein